MSVVNVLKRSFTDESKLSYKSLGLSATKSTPFIVLVQTVLLYAIVHWDWENITLEKCKRKCKNVFIMTNNILSKNMNLYVGI